MTRRIHSGRYEVIGTMLDVLRNDENGQWYYKNRTDDYEGGNDLYATKKEAVAAALDYAAHRQYIKGLGWCYVPAAND